LLQVDDLQQASLLSRVWRPQVAILSRAVPMTTPYLEDLAQLPDLACLPLVDLMPPGDWETALTLGLTLIACPDVINQPPQQAVVSLVQAIAQARSIAKN
ncbi:MAG: hypothetical protein WBG38_05620, partial [Nodosilinea sp.]